MSENEGIPTEQPPAADETTVELKVGESVNVEAVPSEAQIAVENAEKLKAAIEAWQYQQTTVNRPGARVAAFLLDEHGRIVSNPKDAYTEDERREMVWLEFSFKPGTTIQQHPIIERADFRPELPEDHPVRRIVMDSIQSYNGGGTDKPVSDNETGSTPAE